MKKALLVVSLLILYSWAYGQLKSLNCPLEKLQVPAKGSASGEVKESDVKAFINDKLELKTMEYTMFLKSTNSRNFQLKKEPGMLLYELQFHPEDAYLALKGQGRERLLPLYLLLHAIAHTDLKHETCNKEAEAAADKKAGEWLAKLGVNWKDIETMLAGAKLGRGQDLKAGYLTVRKGPTADFIIDSCSNTCTAPCTAVLKSTSANVFPGTTYEWLDENNGAIKIAEGERAGLTYFQPGTGKITLRVTNPDGLSDSFTNTIRINAPAGEPSAGPPTPSPPVPAPNPGRSPKPSQDKPKRKYSRMSLGATVHASFPLGDFRDQNIYFYGVDRWNPDAGMAMQGIGGELFATLRASQWLGFGLQAGYINYPYNGLGLRNDLEQYQLTSGYLLDNKFILSTGYSLGYYGAHLAFVHETDGWYFSAEPGFSRLFTVFQDNQVEVFYRKEDGQPQATRLLYGAPGTPPSNLWMGKLSIGKKLGYKSDHIIHLSGTFLGANYQFARQSHSFGDNSNPLILNTLRVRAAHVGIGYRILF